VIGAGHLIYTGLRPYAPPSGVQAVLIAIFVPTNVHLLEVAGLLDAFFEANCKITSGNPYRVRLVTEEGTAQESASGLKFMPDAGIGDARKWRCRRAGNSGPAVVMVRPL
jgi:transcriptional regulator GlxA family with amidase domain